MLRWCISVVCVLGCVGAQRGAYEVLVEPQAELQLPALPYSYEDLSPHLDSATLRVHHQGHHRAYTDKTNAALQEWREEVRGLHHFLYSQLMQLQDPAADSLARKSIVEILQRLPEVPGQWRTRLRNNGGGYLNHVFYWETMCPAPEGEGPMGVLAEDIAKAFGSVDDFKSAFSSAASGLFGSGYVWLCESSQGELSIVSTQNQVHVTTIGCVALY